jgi:hypothetical protein
MLVDVRRYTDPAFLMIGVYLSAARGFAAEWRQFYRGII